MSDMTTIARPYAKAAFDFAVENGELAQWAEMLTFASEVAKKMKLCKISCTVVLQLTSSLKFLFQYAASNSTNSA